MLRVKDLNVGDRFIDQNGITEIIDKWSYKGKTLYQLYQMEYDNELTVEGSRLAKLLQFAIKG